MDNYALRKSGVIPAGLSPAEMRDWQNGTGRFAPKPEPPKPAFAEATQATKPEAAQAQAQVAAATPAEPQQPADVVTVGDLRKEIQDTAVRVMQAMPEKFRGPVGPKGDPGQNISAEALRRVIAEEIERAISGQPDHFRGQPGQSVGIDDVKKLVAEAVQQTIAANPERFRGLKGDPSTVPGPVGPAGKTIIVERNVIERGPAGCQGIPGPKGDAGMSRDDIISLVCGILQDANAIDQNTMRIVAATMALEGVASSERYNRLGIVRDEIVSKIRKALC